MTTWTPAPTAWRALARAVVGTVKSTSTSGAADSASSSVVASAGSARATSSMSSAPSTARHTVAPIRPAAPATATLIGDPATGLGDGHLGQHRGHRGQGLVEALGLGTDAGRRQALGVPQLVGEGQPGPRSATASMRSTTSSSAISGESARTSEPSRFIRAPVDSSASTTRPLRFSLAR